MRFASSAKVFPHADGHLQTYFNHPIDFLHPIADSTTYEEASLVEPLSVVIQAARRAHITAGQKVLVLGAGAVGLLGSSVSSAYGSTFTCVVDINKDRVDFAVKEAFATKGYVLPVGPRPSSAEESLAKARETATAILEEVLPGGDGFDVVLECTGVESCMQTAIHVSPLSFSANRNLAETSCSALGQEEQWYTLAWEHPTLPSLFPRPLSEKSILLASSVMQIPTLMLWHCLVRASCQIPASECIYMQLITCTDFNTDL